MKWARALPVPTSKSVVIITTCELKPGSHAVVKQARAPTMNRSLVITTSSELTVVASGGSAHP